MNYLCALQRTDGRWEYTYNRHPTGYCREYKPIPSDVTYLSPAQIESYNEKMNALASNFHTTGHESEDEACECYKRYLLDTDLKLQTTEPANATQQHKCKVCDKWTACYAMVGAYRMFDLCPEHQTREEVEKLLSVGESWES